MSEDQNLDQVEAVDNAVPDWVPEKFRGNPEEFGKAYANLERSFHESRQEAKALEESLNTLSAQFDQFQSQANQPDPSAVQEQLQAAWEYDPLGTMQAIAAASAQQAITQYQKQSQQPSGVKPEDFAAYVADQTLAAKYSDYGNLKDKIGEELQGNPLYANDALWVNPELATRALDSAYQAVKARDVLAGNAIAEQQAAETRAMKLAAQTATGAAGREPSPDYAQQRWDEIMNASTGKLGL